MTLDSKTVQAQLAVQFAKELLGSVETLSGIAEEHGIHTLADLFYLHMAICEGGRISYDRELSRVTEIVTTLPSAGLWCKYIRLAKAAFDIKLIEASIKHWEENAATNTEGGDIAMRSCACCKEYRDFIKPGSPRYDDESLCAGCPIAEYTGYSACRGTPYARAEDAQGCDDEAAWSSACADMLELLNEIRADLEKRLNKIEEKRNER